MLIFFSVGRLLGAAIVGGIATSYGGGMPGYQTAFLFMGIPVAAMIFIATRLKSRKIENDDAASESQSAAYSTS